MVANNAGLKTLTLYTHPNMAGNEYITKKTLIEARDWAKTPI